MQVYHVYADYTSSKPWALRYDEGEGRAAENRSPRGRASRPFGEGEQGEIDLLTVSTGGSGIFRPVK